LVEKFRLNKNIVEQEQIYTNNQVGQAIAKIRGLFVDKIGHLLKSKGKNALFLAIYAYSRTMTRSFPKNSGL
jgi:hypothetical protein